MASQITGVSIVCSTVRSGADQRKYQSPVSLAFVMTTHRWPVVSPHIGTVTRKCFHLMRHYEPDREIPDSKIHGANMGPTWVLLAPDGPHVGPMHFAIRERTAEVDHSREVVPLRNQRLYPFSLYLLENVNVYLHSILPISYNQCRWPKGPEH